MKIKLSELKQLIRKMVNEVVSGDEDAWYGDEPWTARDDLIDSISDKWKELNGRRLEIDWSPWDEEELKNLDAELQRDLEALEAGEWEGFGLDRPEDYPAVMNVHKIPEPDDEPAKKQIARLSPAAKSPGRLGGGGTQPWRQGEKKIQTRAQRRLSKALAKDY